MIKLDIINEVVNKTGITKTKAELAVETVFESMKKSLSKGDRIELRGFGVFNVRPRKTGSDAIPHRRGSLHSPRARPSALSPAKSYSPSTDRTIARRSRRLSMRAPSPAFRAGEFRIIPRPESMSEPSPSLPTSTTEYYPPVQVWVTPPPKQRYWLHVLLLVATIFTTLVVGSHMEYNFLQGQSPLSAEDSYIPFFPIDLVWQHPARLLLGIPFSAT